MWELQPACGDALGAVPAVGWTLELVVDVRLLSAVQLRCVRHGSFVASAACVIVPLYPNELTHAAP